MLELRKMTKGVLAEEKNALAMAAPAGSSEAEPSSGKSRRAHSIELGSACGSELVAPAAGARFSLPAARLQLLWYEATIHVWCMGGSRGLLDKRSLYTQTMYPTDLEATY